ncbi:hypothetical protein GCM10009838_70810 [Catenulispora subtropica]|uniref:Uncharacterized protein n=1 Tax=Catenulispora subtropica TaxID=450798 RepID=A0ABN2T1U1_9ACTN
MGLADRETEQAARRWTASSVAGTCGGIGSKVPRIFVPQTLPSAAGRSLEEFFLPARDAIGEAHRAGVAGPKTITDTSADRGYRHAGERPAGALTAKLLAFPQPGASRFPASPFRRKE